MRAEQSDDGRCDHHCIAFPPLGMLVFAGYSHGNSSLFFGNWNGNGIGTGIGI